MLASLDVFVFRMLLVEIDSRLFAFNNCEYVGSIFSCVWTSKNDRKKLVNKNYLKKYIQFSANLVFPDPWFRRLGKGEHNTLDVLMLLQKTI